MYSRRDPSIAGMVLDSPFAKLNDLMLELVQEQQVPIPRALVRLALLAMRRSVRKRAGFDINTISPVDIVSESFVPVLFGMSLVGFPPAVGIVRRPCRIGHLYQ